MILALRQLSKTFDDVPALADVSFAVGAGERVALLRLNGSGKTTLLRILAGLIDADGGSALINGHEPGSLEARAAVSFIPDEPVLYDDINLAEHIEYVARMHGNENWAAEGHDLTKRLGLLDRAADLPATFSRGLRQKTSLTLGLVRPCSLLLVDEPFVGLDRPGRATLLDLLDEASDPNAGRRCWWPRTRTTTWPGPTGASACTTAPCATTGRSPPGGGCWPGRSEAGAGVTAHRPRHPWTSSVPEPWFSGGLFHTIRQAAGARFAGRGTS